MIYLSPTTKIPDKAYYGIMFSAKYSIGGLEDSLGRGKYWMMDNNQFTGDFDFATWISKLLKYQKYSKTCLGIPVPDIVGDYLGTLRLFSRFWSCVKELNYPVAFVSQNGITPEIIPWDYLDVLFVGGDDNHKLGPEASFVISEAKYRGKWVHVGRVNSESRIRQFWMVDSVDGSGLIRDGGRLREKRFRQYSRGIEYAIARKSGKVNENNQYSFL